MKKPVELSQTKYFLAENWKDLLGALSGLAAIIYGVGFLITNIFLLSEYDIYDFSILKARYIYVGVVFSMFLFISFWTAHLIYNNQDKILPTKLQKHFIFQIIYVVVSSIFLGMAAGGLVKSLLIPLASFDRAGLGFTAIQMRIWMVLAILACYYVIWLLKSDFLKSNNAFPIPYSLFTAILIVSILYARLVYPFMPFSLGGGTPIVIKLVIVDEKTDQVNQIIPIESGNTTSTLYLVDQSELSYFILVPNNSAQNLMYPVEIKKDLVLGIVHQKDVAFLFLGSTELMPKVTPSENPTSEP